jgi:hypothetical protein
VTKNKIKSALANYFFAGVDLHFTKQWPMKRGDAGSASEG